MFRTVSSVLYVYRDANGCVVQVKYTNQRYDGVCPHG
jgi:hypothetical protein